MPRPTGIEAKAKRVKVNANCTEVEAKRVEFNAICLEFEAKSIDIEINCFKIERGCSSKMEQPLFVCASGNAFIFAKREFYFPRK